MKQKILAQGAEAIITLEKRSTYTETKEKSIDPLTRTGWAGGSDDDNQNSLLGGGKGVARTCISSELPNNLKCKSEMGRSS